MKFLYGQNIINALRCPICASSMHLQENGNAKCASLLCNGERRHCYDIASSGYVNLMPPGRTAGGDSKSAVRARRDFLSLGYYEDAALALCDAMSAHSSHEGLLIDAGCGEGYYSSMLASRGFSVAGVDLSRDAAEASAKRAAKQNITNAFFSVASVFELPFADGSADAVVNVFAPCAEGEFLRVLRPNGIVAVVYAGPTHLMGLKKALYSETRENDGRSDMPTHMELIEERRVTFDITVEGQQNLQALFAMTPYYWRTSPKDSEKLKSLEKLETPVDMIIAIYRKTDK